MSKRRVVVKREVPQEEQPVPQRVDGSMNHLRIFVYPAYIDKNMPIYRGRKLPITQCVDNPWIEEISRAIADLGLEGIYTIQKRHPRNFWKFGRASVDFYKIDEATGERVLLHPQYPKRKDIYLALANKINENRSKMPKKDLDKFLARKLPGTRDPNAKKVYNRSNTSQSAPKGKK